MNNIHKLCIYCLLILLVIHSSKIAIAGTYQDILLSSSSEIALTGKVVGVNGAPIAGGDIVVCAAYPRVGVSATCPGCYADCGKLTKTNSKGIFQISSVSRDLVFDIMVAHSGFVSAVIQRVDPLVPRVPIKLTLQSHPSSADFIFRGVVVGPSGNPVVGAKVKPVQIRSSRGNISGSVLPGIDRYAVTDTHGNFLLVSESRDAVIGVVVDAPALSPRSFADLHAGKVVTLPLSLGATVIGHVIRGGEPVRGAQIGLVQVNRDIAQFLDTKSAVTDKNGSFQFNNVATGQKYYLYGLMGKENAAGSLAVQQLYVEDAAPLVDLKDIKIPKTRQITGRCILADGHAIPKNSRVLVGRNEAFDAAEIDVDANGIFTLKDAPIETLLIGTMIAGYQIRKTEPGYNNEEDVVDVNVNILEGDLVITLDPVTP
jgi:hypothetical protein